MNSVKDSIRFMEGQRDYLSRSYCIYRLCALFGQFWLGDRVTGAPMQLFTESIKNTFNKGEKNCFGMFLNCNTFFLYRLASNKCNSSFVMCKATCIEQCIITFGCVTILLHKLLSSIDTVFFEIYFPRF